jgi:ADP-dependent NAD(P)H-hydrate dehydratase / NAD(P)H-hydrate epimerase
MSFIQNHVIHKLDLKVDLLKRRQDSHKGDHGCVAIVGGADGMLGALLLATRSAMFSGAGRVYAFALAKDKISVDFNHPEVMYKSIDDFQAMIEHMDAIVIGPGLGKSDSAQSALLACLASNKPLVMDADALNLIAEHPHIEKMLTDRYGDTALTPHPGEASRLLNLNIDAIQENRPSAAMVMANRFNCICLLKGANSICANNKNEYWINTTGNSGLASAGTGDVLSGVIGGLIAQGLPCLEAVKLGAYVHGLAADYLVDNGTGPIGLTASEVACTIRDMINQL